ncbi:uncharacterized protein LOC135830862 [Sycon ciliatum]|uniref:uncharacterized protein LOC135830862 n=1 Tax=Sycon ciliatum TaxID=27933 RepID=UPI0031F6B26C
MFAVRFLLALMKARSDIHSMWLSMGIIVVTLLSHGSVAQDASGSDCDMVCTVVVLSGTMANCSASQCTQPSPSNVTDHCSEDRIVTLETGEVEDVGLEVSYTDEMNDTIMITLTLGGSNSCCADVPVPSSTIAEQPCGSVVTNLACSCQQESTDSITTINTEPTTADDSDDGFSLGVIIGIAVGGAVVLFLVLLLIVIIMRRRKQSHQAASFMKGTALTFDNPGFEDPVNGSSLQRPVTIRARKQGTLFSIRQRFSLKTDSTAGTLNRSSNSPELKDREHPVYRCERRIDDIVLEKAADALEIDVPFRNLLIMLGHPDLLDDVRKLPEGEGETDDILVWLCLKTWRDTTLGTYSSLARALRNLKLLEPLDELKGAVDVMDNPVPAYNFPQSAGVLSNTAQDNFLTLIEGHDSSLASTFQQGSQGDLRGTPNGNGVTPGAGTSSFGFFNAATVDLDESMAAPPTPGTIPEVSESAPTSPWDTIHLKEDSPDHPVDAGQTENPYNSIAFVRNDSRGPPVELDVDKKYQLQPVIAPVVPASHRQSRNSSPALDLETDDTPDGPPLKKPVAPPRARNKTAPPERTDNVKEEVPASTSPEAVASETVYAQVAESPERKKETKEVDAPEAVASETVYAQVAESPEHKKETKGAGAPEAVTSETVYAQVAESPEREQEIKEADAAKTDARTPPHRFASGASSAENLYSEANEGGLIDTADSQVENPYASLGEARAGVMPRKRGPQVQPYRVKEDTRKDMLRRMLNADGSQEAGSSITKRASWAGGDTSAAGLDPRRRSFVARNPEDPDYAFPDKSPARASCAVFTVPRSQNTNMADHDSSAGDANQEEEDHSKEDSPQEEHIGQESESAEQSTSDT